MALRIHVLAAFNTDRDFFRQLWKDLPANDPVASGKWIFTRASVWHVNSEDLDKRLCEVPGLAMRITTVDGSIWNLHLFQNREKVHTFTHDFSLLTMWEEDPEEVDELIQDRYQNRLDLFLEDNFTVPAEVIAEVADQSWDEALETLIHRPADRIVEALGEVGIPHDPDEVRQILIGASVTYGELEWDLGTLPRFLDAIDLGQVFEGWEEEIPYDEIGDEDLDDDYVERTLALTSSQKAKKIKGKKKKITLPLEDLSKLYQLGWYLDGEVECLLWLDLPARRIMDRDWTHIYGLQIRERDDRVALAFYRPDSRWEMVEILREVGRELAKLDEEAIIEMVLAGRFDVSNHRYRGEMKGDKWSITHSWPPVSAKTLGEALDLVDEVEGDAPLQAADEDEGKEVLALAENSPYLLEWNVQMDDKLALDAIPKDPKAKWVEIFDSRSCLGRHLIRTRFRNTWDTSEVEAWEWETAEESVHWEEEVDEGDDLLRAPIDRDRPIYQGRFSEFWPSKMEDLVQLEPEDLVSIDGEMQEMGLLPLGDMVCETFPDAVIRGYGGTGKKVYGVLLVTTTGFVRFELYSTFDNGTSLTTTTAPQAKDEPEKGIYRISQPEGGLAELYFLHGQGLAQRENQGTHPYPAVADLASLARELDGLLIREDE